MNLNILQEVASSVTVGELFNQLFTVGCFSVLSMFLLFSVLIKLQYQVRLSQYQMKARTTFRERRRGL